MNPGSTVIRNVLGNVITRVVIHPPVDIEYSGTSFESIENSHVIISGHNAISYDDLFQLVEFCGSLELLAMNNITGGYFR